MATAPPPARPHIILLVPDQWRGDCLGYAGHPAVRTPVLDRWVREEAVGFRQAYCQNPVCTPSRCSFMTGWYPHVAGHRTMNHLLHAHEPNLLRDLKQAGYRVWWGGKNDLLEVGAVERGSCTDRVVVRDAPAANLHVEQSWRGAPGGDGWFSFLAGRLPPSPGAAVRRDSDWELVQRACAAIADHDPGRPLCLYLCLESPHPPYGVEDPWFGAVDRRRLPARLPAPAPGAKPVMHERLRDGQRLGHWDEERWDELRATYLGMCGRTDHLIGLVEEALRARGMWDGSAVFVFADHGDYTGDYGLVEKAQNLFEDCLTRVPLVVKPPGGAGAHARVCDALTELVDVPATVWDLAGVEPDHDHFGRSLVPLLRGPGDRHRPAVVCEGGRLAHEAQFRECAPLSDQARNLYLPRARLQELDAVAHGKAIMYRTATHKLVRRLREADELYDLGADPGEQVNRCGDPALAAVEAALRAGLATHLLETADAVPRMRDARW